MTGPTGEASISNGGMISGVFTAGLLPHRGREAVGDDLAEHQQDFLTPRRGQARPSSGQWSGKARGLQARGGTTERWGWDMVGLRAIRRDVIGTIAPTAAAQPH